MGFMVGHRHGPHPAGAVVTHWVCDRFRLGPVCTGVLPEVAELCCLRQHGDCGHWLGHPRSGGLRHRAELADPGLDARLGGLHHHRPGHVHVPGGTLLGHPLPGGVDLRPDRDDVGMLLRQLGRDGHGLCRVGPRVGGALHQELCSDSGSRYDRCCDHAPQPLPSLRLGALAEYQPRLSAPRPRGHLVQFHRVGARAAGILHHQPRRRRHQRRQLLPGNLLTAGARTLCLYEHCCLRCEWTTRCRGGCPVRLAHWAWPGTVWEHEPPERGLRLAARPRGRCSLHLGFRTPGGWPSLDDDLYLCRPDHHGGLHEARVGTLEARGTHEGDRFGAVDRCGGLHRGRPQPLREHQRVAECAPVCAAAFRDASSPVLLVAGRPHGPVPLAPCHASRQHGARLLGDGGECHLGGAVCRGLF
mmetsp:Transcript_103700/g.334290  ORF Transcript_103700/g.334290 Transcript_103700/m.334290 type:complete len:415 (+) Transcript_103700:252-1496(+)